MITSYTATTYSPVLVTSICRVTRFLKSINQCSTSRPPPTNTVTVIDKVCILKKEVIFQYLAIRTHTLSPCIRSHPKPRFPAPSSRRKDVNQCWSLFSDWLLNKSY